MVRIHNTNVINMSLIFCFVSQSSSELNSYLCYLLCAYYGAAVGKCSLSAGYTLFLSINFFLYIDIIWPSHVQ